MRLPFRMSEVTIRVMEHSLIREELMMKIPAAHADRIDVTFSSIKFF